MLVERERERQRDRDREREREREERNKICVDHFSKRMSFWNR